MLVVATTSCTTDQSSRESGAAPTPTSLSTTTPEQPSPTSVPAQTTPHPEPIQVPRKASLQAVMAKPYRAGRFDIIGRVGDYGAYVRSEVRYRSDGRWVTAIMNRPNGRGPFPAIVLSHGYIEPSVYVTGQGLAREQDALARAGYVVLHTDYRGHAGSGPTSVLDRETRLGYTEDVITAVHTVAALPYVDADRLALLGRSMGGGITLNALVSKPGLVDAAVLYAPVSSRFVDNLNRWTRPERPEVASRLLERLGPARERPQALRDLSSRTFFKRITEPVLIHHGTADESCPLRWSRATYAALGSSDAQARLIVYPGEPHAFVAQWQRSMDTTLRWLRRQL